MPRIPTYDELQVQARPVPAPNASPGLFDAGAQQQMQVGQALQQAGGALNDVAVRMQDRENADKLFQVETAIKNNYLTFEQGARERRGQAAWGVTQDTARWWDDTAKQQADTLDNDAQRKLFAQTVAKLRMSSIDSVSRFESEQRRVSLEESAKSSIAGSINMAASMAASAPKSTTETASDGSTVVRQSFDVSGFKNDIIKRVDVEAQINGWSPERRDYEAQQQLTDFHKQVIQNRLDRDPAGARAYFEANRAEIAGSQYDPIEKALKLGGLKETAQGFADQAQQSNLTEDEAVRAARAKYSGEEEDAVVREVKERFAEQGAARERSQKTAADTAWGIYARSGRVSDIPAGVMAQMDGRDLVAIKRAATTAAEDKMPKTDWNRYYELRQQAFTDPEGFANYDLRREFPYLGRGEREGLIDLQTKAHNGSIKEVATLENQLTNMHDTLGWGSGNMRDKGQFDTAVQREIDTEEKAAGKKLNYEQRQKIIDRMAIERSNSLFQFGSTRFYQVVGMEEEAAFTPKIPDAERTKIEAALKRAGRPVSDTAVMQLYKRKNGLQ